MGRPKDGNRTKGRPSSSSMAASLLPSGAAAVGFGGFMGSSRVDSAVSSDASIPFNDIDGEVVQHLKRLARKDPTTKLKALSSLSMLFKEKSGREIVPIIPQWVFEYKKLLFDYNREVRRATHEAMTLLVTAVGRDLAPFLKSFMGPWWFSQFDPASEVSQAAKRSLQAAFPAPEKRLDALVLCTAEIVLYLQENLNLTPQSISEKTTAVDELEEMHQQAISSSLLALATFLDILVGLSFENTGSENPTVEKTKYSKAQTTLVIYAEKLFSTHKCFLDFLKSPSPAIRSATYSVHRSYIKNIPSLCEGNMKLLAPAILGSFQEKDQACHSSMWEMMLLFCKQFPNCWTTINVQKNVLNRLWHFLRNGCCGSHQVSYPALVLFLDVIPPKIIEGEKFFLDFFQNFWYGGNKSYTSSSDQVAFFQAFRECFIWALKNSSRFCDGIPEPHTLQVALIHKILIGLLWRDYLPISSKQMRVSSEGKSQREEVVRSPQTQHPTSFVHFLGKCIIEILSGIYSVEHDLLSVFCVEFRENCAEMFYQIKNNGDSSESIERVINFFSLLGQNSVQKGEEWPLLSMVGPMFQESIPLIRSIDSTDIMRLLSAAVSVFGPRNIVSVLVCSGSSYVSSLSESSVRELDLEQFLQLYKEIIVPWCLQGNNSSTSARIDFLLLLLDNDCFKQQWDSILTYANDQQNLTAGCGTLNHSYILTMAILFEKAKVEIDNRKHLDWLGSDQNHWHHELLDSFSVSVASSFPLIGNPEGRLLRAILCGSTIDDQTYFLSGTAKILVLKELCRKLIAFMMSSSHTWVSHACSLLTTEANVTVPSIESDILVLQGAHFALDVLAGSLFCLKTIDDVDGLVPAILVPFFLIDWEYSAAIVSVNALDVEPSEKVKARIDFCASMHALCGKISTQFLKSLSSNTRRVLGSILVLAIRFSIFNENDLGKEKLVSLCSLWILEVLDCLCQDHFEEQELLDQFLSKDGVWPSWVLPDLFSAEEQVTVKIQTFSHNNASRNHIFIAVIVELISKVGIDKVIAGSVSHDPSSKETSNQSSTPHSHGSRAWLAAEILCSWKWDGGSALSSFLPLITYGKGVEYRHHEGLLDSIVSILLDGVLVHGTSCHWSLKYVWSVSYDDIDLIEEPFLRGLASLLLTMFEGNVWVKTRAIILFKLLVDKLSVGEEINVKCLGVLPLLMSILIRPLSAERDVSSDGVELDYSRYNPMDDYVQDWLQRTLTFSPLNAWRPGQGMEDWLQLIISCYPLNTISVSQRLKPVRDSSPKERGLLLELFRKQRTGNNSSASIKLSTAQALLGKLVTISVGYCWKEFNEADWDFVVYQIRSSIEPSVVMMEEVAESVNEVITNRSDNDLSEVVKQIELIVSKLNPWILDIATNALAAFSLFCEIIESLKEGDADDLNPLKSEKWNLIKDRILEGVLRLFFSTGAAEAIAGISDLEASCVIASTRLAHPHFWELVSSTVVKSSPYARDKAVKSVQLWELSKGPISSLYAMLFTSKPFPGLQYAAFVILSSEPVSEFSIICEDSVIPLNGDDSGNQDSNNLDTSLEENVNLRVEISRMLENKPNEIIEMDLLAPERVNVFLAWSLLLSRLLSFPSSSPARRKLVQHIQEHTNSTIVDCLFQHIPLESCSVNNFKKNDSQMPPLLSEAANSANRAIRCGSIVFCIETLWPVGPEKMASFAGAIFGLMLCSLPAYLRGWFSEIRDRNTSMAIEFFTKTWCSPPLIMNELSLIKKASFADENFSVTVSKSANEVVATYTKDETGMDLVIRLPASYPLRSVDVDCPRSLGISEVKQRKWLLSMLSFVRNQNGALAEAIQIWKNNFDKEFEGVEECPICYSVIHTVNHNLPRMACKTCKHKFHSACLYKWFSTSHKSTCPLCQSPF